MRKKLYLFNPDHDLALANHDINYMPPASARQFSTDLALFPAWYAGEGNVVLAPSAYNLLFLEAMHHHFPQLASLLTEAEVATTHDVDFVPWGWDPAVYKRLIQLGVAPAELPTYTQLDGIREKSHRLQAVELLKRLQFDQCCGESYYITALDELRSFVESRTSCVLKAPLSGSGKGLNWCKGMFTSHINDWCRNVIRQQGGVVAEPLYDKVADFAMQFYADSAGHVSFTGYSLFRTGNSGAYGGNLITTDAEIESRLTRYIPLSVLHRVRMALEKELSGLLDQTYIGYLGVDMMICRSYDVLKYHLHPCVEINLRMNMGMASRIIYNTFIQKEKSGILKISYFSSGEELLKEHNRMLEAYPLRMEDGRITEGYLSLVPVTSRSRYYVWVLIGSTELF